MKSFIKWGAVTLLTLMVIPIVVPASRNPELVLPTWVIVTYAVISVLVPARRDIVIVASVMSGHVAWRLLQAAVVGQRPEHLAVTCGLALALLWLLASPSRWAARAAIAVELVGLGLLSPNVPQIIAEMDTQAADLVPALVALYLCPIVAVVLLAPIAARSRARTERVAEAFD